MAEIDERAAAALLSAQRALDHRNRKLPMTFDKGMDDTNFRSFWTSSLLSCVFRE